MSSTSSMKSVRKPRRVLAPTQKWELLLAVKTGTFTQAQAAAKWRIDRSTVSTIIRVGKEGAMVAFAAKPGRPGKTAEQVALEAANAEIETLRQTVTAQAVELHLHRGKSRWD